MKVYVCDDSESDLMRLRRYLKKYAGEENLEMEVEEFLSAEEMFRAHDGAKEKPALLFLDIYMDRIDGIEAARKLRDSGVRTSIFFTTSSMEHAMEAFWVHADGYLHKPFNYEDFCHAMGKIDSQLRAEGKTIEVRSERMSLKFRIRDICFAETENHGVGIHSMDGVCRANVTMEGLKKMLAEEKSFVTCGRSYLINLSYVDTIDNEVIHMKNGETITIPVRLRKQFREQYQQYLHEK